MNIFEKFPKSQLLNVLLEKVNAQGDKYNDLCNEVCKFREHIVQELRQINELFTEYTPHDEDYHISHLLKISDILLGEEKYQKMNTIELFLLLISMYAHDWGMAVSKNERFYIVTKKKQDGSPEINLLEDEYDRFEQFIMRKVGKIKFEEDEQIDMHIWQEYIRNTHAIRSGKRVYSYFINYNNSIAGALEKICIGHWLEIEEISENNGYYKDASVCGENVNLKALSVYIRLIDLFDLAEDRTPYVLWKYVNPQNNYSKMEWEKHRALHQITCPSYEGGRVICISGSTDNHEVYAALMDFKRLCERYFRECIDMIAHMNDPKYELGVHLLDWRIEARNFKPIDISFSFNKEHIFQILGDEIYDYHPYVYIRELIQNNVDAITLRKEILNRKKVGGDNIGYIHFNVEWESEDVLTVLCSDDGIGMDEYILKNYFSVLGKSYYHSSDFKNKGININAISKFGIGILSCFSVADHMDIMTKREPYMEEGRNGLKVIINDIQKSFRIEELPEYKCDVGTKIKLYIKKNDLIKQLEKKELSIEDYNITEYIKFIAHYIKYPIIIKEHGINTIILPMDYDIKKIQSEVSNIEEYTVFRFSDEYPINDMVFEQDVEHFNNTFDIKIIDVNNDLGMSEIEGIICFSTLKNYYDEISNPTHCYPANQILINNKTRIRWDKHFFKEYDTTKGHNNIMLYNKGILIEENKPNYFFDGYKFLNYNKFRTNIFPAPYVKINFPNAISGISVSRFSIENQEKMTIYNMWGKLIDYISAELKKEKGTDNVSYDFWRKLSIFAMQYHINSADFDENVFKDVYFPFINEKGDLIYEKINDMKRISLIPAMREDILDKYGLSGKYEQEQKWEYGKCILARELTHLDWDYDNSISNAICTNIYIALKRNYFFKTVNFIKDNNYEFPIEQHIYEIGDNSNTIKKIVAILSKFEASYENDSSRIKKLLDHIWGLNNIAEFSDEYSYCFAYGRKMYNLNHKNMHMLTIYYWLLENLMRNNKNNKTIIKNKIDQLLDLPLFNIKQSYAENSYSFSKINNTLKELHIWLKTYYPNLENIEIIFSKKDFVDKTIELISDDCFKYVEDVDSLL